MASRQPASPNLSRVDGRAYATSTPKRSMRSRYGHQKKAAPRDAIFSEDELSTNFEAGDTRQAGPDEGVVLDEIVVSEVALNTSTKDGGPNGNRAVAGDSPARGLVGVPRRAGRAASFSQSGSPAMSSPSGRGVSIKKQDFEVAIAADDDGMPDELSYITVPPKRQKVHAAPTPRVTFRKSRSKWDNPDEMLTNPNAPLVEARLRELLCSPRAWDVLTPGERETILAKFPDETEILDRGTPDARPDIAALRNNDNFRHDVARYQEGLGKGYHDPDWIQQAQAAHTSRQLGFYDDFMASDFEERWNMPMPKQPDAAGSESVANGLWQQTDGASEGHMNGNSAESKATMLPEAVVHHHEGRIGELEALSTGAQHEEETDVSASDPMDNFEDNNDKNVGPNNKPGAKYKGDQSPNHYIKQLGPAYQDAVTARISAELVGQGLGHTGQDVKSSDLSSLPNSPRNAEDQSESKMSWIQDSDDADSAGTSSGASAQDGGVPSAGLVVGGIPTIEAQPHQGENEVPQHGRDTVGEEPRDG
ncbi:Asx homology domain-containing protein [Xylaria palmicola]|nr:Asx homology domain-containing protein [Xylaria palmicola]